MKLWMYIVPFDYYTDRNFFEQFKNYLVNSIGFI